MKLQAFTLAVAALAAAACSNTGNNAGQTVNSATQSQAAAAPASVAGKTLSFTKAGRDTLSYSFTSGNTEETDTPFGVYSTIYERVSDKEATLTYVNPGYSRGLEFKMTFTSANSGTAKCTSIESIMNDRPDTEGGYTFTVTP